MKTLQSAGACSLRRSINEKTQITGKQTLAKKQLHAIGHVQAARCRFPSALQACRPIQNLMIPGLPPTGFLPLRDPEDSSHRFNVSIQRIASTHRWISLIAPTDHLD
ncbi:hypothetical protein CPCC7001_454 [Cyanobium sp. PCC 7001]|nr:hypothetical protein CPCC7001_454 [Cyanobium sp. PCC 7001]